MEIDNLNIGDVLVSDQYGFVNFTILNITLSTDFFFVSVSLSLRYMITLLTPGFNILPCSLIPTYKYDLAIILHSKSLKKCHKNFENWLNNRNLKSKDDLDQVFCMCKGFIIIIIISVFEPVFLYRGLGFLTSLPRRRPLHSERF